MTSSSLTIQLRVIKALYIREMISHFGRKNIGFLWMFIEPMMFSVGIAILWSLTLHSFGSIPPAGFALTGYSALVAWRNCVGRTSLAIQANLGLIYHQNITILDLAITRAIFEFTATTISLIFLTIIFAAFGLIHFPVNPLEALLGWFLLGWFYVGAGLIALFLNERSEIFHRVWHIVMYLTMPLTGAFSMVSWLPKNVQSLLLLSPMVNGVEILREGYFGASIDAKYSIPYLLTINLITLLIGLLLVKRIKKFVEVEG